MKKILITGFCSAILWACSSESGVKITKAQYGERWPFTIDEAFLECRGHREVVLNVGRKTYGLSGEAVGSEKYLDVDHIWREDPKMKGTKVVLTPILEKGMRLCQPSSQ